MPDHLDHPRPTRPAVLQRIRGNPTGRVALKVIFGVVGALLIVTGLILVPLPGPGWLIVIAGLAVLAVEFAWARHLLLFTRRQLRRWTQWMLRRGWPVRLAAGAAGIVLVAAVVWSSVRISLGIDLVAVGWHYVSSW